MLRLRTYLAPSIPEHLFTTLADLLAAELDRPVALTIEERVSGPGPDEVEPFTSGAVDVAFMCATSWAWLAALPDPPVRLVGAAWVPTDPRACGRPVYFADVLVRDDGPSSLADLTDLVGRRVAYNDEVSLSGLHGLRLAMEANDVAVEALDLRRSGSHLASLRMLARGEVDAASVDSTVWWRLREAEGAAGLRLLAALGPHPIQPVACRADLPHEVADAVRDVLLQAHQDPAAASALAAAGLRHFVGVTPADYAGLAATL